MRLPFLAWTVAKRRTQRPVETNPRPPDTAELMLSPDGHGRSVIKSDGPTSSLVRFEEGATRAERSTTQVERGATRAETRARSTPVPILLTKQVRGEWPSILAVMALAVVLSGGTVYLATYPTSPIDSIPTLIRRPAFAHSAPPVTSEMVRFANPFDPAEVFEFPSGTSETDAQQAVADLLLQRARDRLTSGVNFTRQRKRTASRAAPATPSFGRD